MDEIEFDVITTLISSREPTKSAARRVMIDQMAPADAARELNLSPQSVSNTLRRIRKAEDLILKAYRPRKGA